MGVIIDLQAQIRELQQQIQQLREQQHTPQSFAARPSMGNVIDNPDGTVSLLLSETDLSSPQRGLTAVSRDELLVMLTTMVAQLAEQQGVKAPQFAPANAADRSALLTYR
ncbi:MAG: hypothetical protein ACHP9Y_05355 [Gammaproteobacteria bacterium]